MKMIWQSVSSCASHNCSIQIPICSALFHSHQSRVLMFTCTCLLLLSTQSKKAQEIEVEQEEEGVKDNVHCEYVMEIFYSSQQSNQ